MVDTSPIDVTTDYDLFDPDFVRDPFTAYDQIREQCPVAHTERHGGSWMPTRYEDLRDFVAETDLFSSDEPLVTAPPKGQSASPYADVKAPPISSDPPEHGWTRRLILPIFAPGAVQQYEQGTRDLCNSLIDGFIENGRADVGTDYAQQIPVRVIATMLGVGTERADEFVGWVRGILELGLINPEIRSKNRTALIGFFEEQIEDRRANPREDDLISDLVSAEVDGKPVPQEIILGVCNLMLVAGVDTTWSAIGASLWHFAHHRGHRQQLRDDPDIWPLAVEELLRVYSPVTMARVATEDTEFKGCPIKQGDRIIMAFPAGNRDPEVFENPHDVILDRERNRHIVFGSGIHRCAGSNLARLEVRVALQTFLERIPDFELVDPDAVTWAGGQVRGPRICEVTFPA